jgi:5'-nucleotidase
MNIVVTNDDGIYAEGIEVLSDVASEFGDVTVVAPRHPHSGCSHQMTFDGHLDSAHLGGNRHWIDGFPADCVRIALAEICPEVDLVVSGVNHGSNLGLDNFLSGTVAAAREATFFGLPAIAFSQYHRGLDDEVWAHARAMTRRLMKWLLADRLKPGHYWNVNFPVVREQDPEQLEIMEAKMDLSPLPNRYLPRENGYYYDGDYHARKHAPDSDVAACQAGKISVTLVRIVPVEAETTSAPVR